MFRKRSYIGWSRRYAERIWGEFFILVRRILGKLPANFSANFDGEFWKRIFRPCFSRFSGHPKNSRPKFTSRIVGIPLQFHFLEPKIYSRRFSAYVGDQHWAALIQWKGGDGRGGGFISGCQYVVSPHGRTGNRTVTQMRHTLPFESGKKKAHKHKLFCPVGPSFHRICPRDKPSLSLGQIRWKTGTNPGIPLILHSGSPISPGLSLGQTRFVPGTIPGTKGGTESLCEKNLCAFFARYWIGRTRRGSYSPKRRVSAFYVPSRQPLLRTPSKNPS